MKYKNFIKFHQKTVLQSKIQNFNSTLKKQNVHNRLYNDSIKKKKVLNDLQLKYMAAEARQYTFIPRVNHNCNLCVKKNIINKRSYKTPLTRKNTQNLETSGKMKEIFSIKRNINSKWNKSEKKNVNNLNEYSNKKVDIGTYYIKDKSRGIYKKVNNYNLQSRLLRQRNPIKSFHKSMLLNTNKKDGFSKLTKKNLEFNNNSLGNNNNRINIRINTNINNQLLNELNTYRLNNHKYFTTINNLFKDDIIVNNNFLYNTNNTNPYNNKTIQENKPHYNEYSNIQISISDTKAKNSVIKNNYKNKKIKSENRLNNHSISTGAANINLQNNLPSSIKKEKKKESNISFKTLEINRNISDCFSLLFNNYLKKNENKIQYEAIQLENRKIKKKKNFQNKKKKICKVKTSINSISSHYNLYSDKLPCNDNNYFYSIDYGNNLTNNNNFNTADNNCYFIREKNKFLYTNSKELLFDLSHLNNNDNKNNNSEIKAKYYTIDIKKDKDNSDFKRKDLNHKSKIKNKEKNFPDKKIKNNNLILNTYNKVKKDLLPELNKNNIINSKLKIENFNFNSLEERHEKSETKNLEKKNYNKEKIKKLSLINIENNYIQNENNIYMKNKIKEKSNIKEKINTKTNINKVNKMAIKEAHFENVMNEEKKDYMNNKKGKGIENEENNNFDKMSIQSMSDSKIYELANNYMKNEDLIDKHQINNILFNKKNKYI